MVHFVELFCAGCSISTPGNLRAKLDTSNGHFPFGIFLHIANRLVSGATANPYGITLDRVWTDWAAQHGVSETIAAALCLISRNRRVGEVVVKLTPGEVERVIDIVQRWPDHFPSGALVALKNSRPTSSLERSAACGSPMRDGPRRREARAESRIYCCKLSTGPFIAKPGPAAPISDHSLAAFLKPLLRHFWRHLRHFWRQQLIRWE